MKELDLGHKYELETYDGNVPVVLTFVKREGTGFPFNHGHYAGTNLQETMRADIKRLKFLQAQALEMSDSISAAEDLLMIVLLRQVLLLLEQRAARRHNRQLLLSVEELNNIEVMPTCPTCGHIDPQSHKHGGEHVSI